jgi:hypothetical protein
MIIKTKYDLEQVGTLAGPHFGSHKIRIVGISIARVHDVYEVSYRAIYEGEPKSDSFLYFLENDPHFTLDLEDTGWVQNRPDPDPRLVCHYRHWKLSGRDVLGAEINHFPEPNLNPCWRWVTRTPYGSFEAGNSYTLDEAKADVEDSVKRWRSTRWS